MGSLITLGQVPIFVPDRYQYSFEEIAKNMDMPRSFEMDIATHVWFWDMFVINKKFDQKTGRWAPIRRYFITTPGHPRRKKAFLFPGSFTTVASQLAR